jgi:hypothetical protein
MIFFLQPLGMSNPGATPQGVYDGCVGNADVSAIGNIFLFWILPHVYWKGGKIHLERHWDRGRGFG